MLLVSMQQILKIRHLSLELVEVVTRAVDWPAEKEDVRSKSIAVKSVVERFQESAKQAAAFQKLLPCHTHISRAAEREKPQTSEDRYYYFYESCGEEVLMPEGSGQREPSRSGAVNTSFYGASVRSGLR